jgi:hypothetical protein
MCKYLIFVFFVPLPEKKSAPCWEQHSGQAHAQVATPGVAFGSFCKPAHFTFPLAKIANCFIFDSFSRHARTISGTRDYCDRGPRNVTWGWPTGQRPQSVPMGIYP